MHEIKNAKKYFSQFVTKGLNSFKVLELQSRQNYGSREVQFTSSASKLILAQVSASLRKAPQGSAKLRKAPRSLRKAPQGSAKSPQVSAKLREVSARLRKYPQVSGRARKSPQVFPPCKMIFLKVGKGSPARATDNVRARVCV